MAGMLPAPVPSLMRGIWRPDCRAFIPAAEIIGRTGIVGNGRPGALTSAFAEQDSAFGDFSQRIQTVSDREALMQTLAAELPGLGFRRATWHSTRIQEPGAARLLSVLDRPGGEISRQIRPLFRHPDSCLPVFCRATSHNR
jgi:hypothetical protein